MQCSISNFAYSAEAASAAKAGQFPNREKGYAALITVLLVVATSLLVISGFTSFALQEVAINRTYERSVEAFAAAEAGNEDALLRLVLRKQITSGEVLAVGNATTTIAVTSVGYDRIVRADGVRGDANQSVESRLETSTAGASFFYGMQVGAGGLSMQNTTEVNGSVYSNGNIAGTNSPRISGDAFAAASSSLSGLTVNGNSQAYAILTSTVNGYASSTTKIDQTTVGKDAHADELKRSTINRDAYYRIIDLQTTVAGQRFPGTPPPASLPALSMPISDSQLDQWEAQAEAGGVISGPCPYKPAHGSTIGPAKVLCDVVIDGTTQVTQGGILWVVGNFDMKNSAVLRLASSFGADSSVVIADDPANRSARSTVTVENTVQIEGSGTAGSYIMVVSRNTSMESGGTVVAIEVKNSSAASVYYAPHGKLKISNNTNLKEATAYGIEMANQAELTYESGLADMTFSSGPSGGYELRYWKRVE